MQPALLPLTVRLDAPCGAAPQAAASSSACLPRQGRTRRVHPPRPARCAARLRRVTQGAWTWQLAPTVAGGCAGSPPCASRPSAPAAAAPRQLAARGAAAVGRAQTLAATAQILGMPRSAYASCRRRRWASTRASWRRQRSSDPAAAAAAGAAAEAAATPTFHTAPLPPSMPCTKAPPPLASPPPRTMAARRRRRCCCPRPRRRCSRWRRRRAGRRWRGRRPCLGAHPHPRDASSSSLSPPACSARASSLPAS